MSPGIWLTVALASALAAGCSSLLPKAESETQAPWRSFEDARRAYDSIEPGRTTLQEVQRLGFDPSGNRNVTVLSFSDIVAKYAPASIRDEYLDPGIRECLRLQARCSAYSIEHRQIHRARVGNFFLDFINFKRRTEITGWRFAAVVVVVDDRVAYKSWSGLPAISEVEETRNPLGPLQDAGPSLLRQ